jgi:glycosyltransferase involved in cell wall biosynthesis
VRDELLAKGVGRAKQYAVVPLGVPLEHLRTLRQKRGSLRQELGIAGDPIIITIVARLTPIKRHTDFLAAAKMVVQSRPHCCFLIVGDGEERQNLENITQSLGLEKHVLFLGWRQDLDRIYADSDIVALTSANEGLPVSLIEAMAAGCAVVATRVGGVPDLIEAGKTGLIVPPGNTEAIAAALIQLIDDPRQRTALGEAAQVTALKQYPIERLVEDIDSLYQQKLRNMKGYTACTT